MQERFPLLVQVCFILQPAVLDNRYSTFDLFCLTLRLYVLVPESLTLVVGKLSES